MRRAEFNVGSLPHSVGSGLSGLTLKLASAQTGMKTFRNDKFRLFESINADNINEYNLWRNCYLYCDDDVLSPSSTRLNLYHPEAELNDICKIIEELINLPMCVFL